MPDVQTHVAPRSASQPPAGKPKFGLVGEIAFPGPRVDGRADAAETELLDVEIDGGIETIEDAESLNDEAASSASDPGDDEEFDHGVPLEQLVADGGIELAAESPVQEMFVSLEHELKRIRDIYLVGATGSNVARMEAYLRYCDPKTRELILLSVVENGWSMSDPNFAIGTKMNKTKITPELKAWAIQVYLNTCGPELLTAQERAALKEIINDTNDGTSSLDAEE